MRERRRCAAITLGGGRCTRLSYAESNLCAQHRSVREQRDEPAEEQEQGVRRAVGGDGDEAGRDVPSAVPSQQPHVPRDGVVSAPPSSIPLPTGEEKHKTTAV